MRGEGEAVDNATEVLAGIRRIKRPDQPGNPALLAGLARLDTVASQREAGRLLAGVPVDRIAPEQHRWRPLRVAIAGTFTAEGIAPLLRVHLLRAGIDARIHVCGFNQLLAQLSDPGSTLAGFQPDVTLCLLHDGAFLPQAWDPTAVSALRDSLTHRLAMVEQAVTGFAARTAGAVVLHTVPLSPTEYRRVIGLKSRTALGRVWRELNLRLLDLAELAPAVHTLDLETVLMDQQDPVRDDRLYQFASMAWTPATELTYAREAAAFCRAVAGLSKKVLVVDLDNTLWGGVLGDDGPAGIEIGGRYPGNCYTEMQRGLVALRQQGVLLAVCSKNEQSAVEDVFAHHPELVLRSDDFVALVANWGRKDHNIRQLAQTLNLGLEMPNFIVLPCRRLDRFSRQMLSIHVLSRNV